MTTDDTSTTRSRGNELYCLAEEVPTLDPVAATSAGSEEVLTQVCSGLTSLVPGGTDANLDLAADLTVGDQSKIYDFTLRADATFHDDYGPVRASDVVYSFERLAGSPRSARSAYVLDMLGLTHETDSDGEYVHGSLGVQARGERTVRLSLQEPFHSTLELLAHPAFSVVPEGIVGDPTTADDSGGSVAYDTFSERPVGAGPFRIDEWVTRDDELRELWVERAPGYAGTAPEVEAIRWLCSQGMLKHHDRVTAGDVDLFDIRAFRGYDRDDITVERTDDAGRELGTYDFPDGQYRYCATPTTITFYVGFNTSAVPRYVRRAFADILDQEGLLADCFERSLRPAYHVTPPGIFPGGDSSYHDHAEASYPYGIGESRIDSARERLEAAGHDAQNPYELSITTYIEKEQWQHSLDRIAGKLSDAHVEMSVSNEYTTDMLAGAREGALEAYVLGWVADWPAADSMLQLLDPPRTDLSAAEPVAYVDWNGTDAADRATAAWEEIRGNQAPDPDQRATREEAYRTIERANWEDVCYVPLYHNISEHLWHPSVSVTPIGPAGSHRHRHTETTVRSDEN